MIEAKDLKIEEVEKYYIIHEEGFIENRKTKRHLKPQDNGNGYLKVTLTIKGKQYQRYVHRLVAEVFSDREYWQTQVNHIDGVKSNNYAQNLEWVTNSENQKHAHRTGLKQNGNELWNGKFSKEDIKRIFDLKNKGVKGCLIAKEMECSNSTISEILNGKRYKIFITHLQEMN